MAIATLELGEKAGTVTMSLEEEDNDEQEPGQGADTTKRSERKRQREKQRRFDLSNAFDELAAFINQVEPEAGDLDLDSKKKRKKSGESEDTSGITRLDLIGRAVKIMKRLHRENEERKRIIASMQDRGGAPHGPSDNVLVMVPTLAPVDDGTYPMARATYPPMPPHSSYYHHGGPPVHHGNPPDYAMSRGQPQYSPPPNWNQRYAAPPPPHHYGMQPVHQGRPVQRSPDPRNDPVNIDGRPV